LIAYYAFVSLFPLLLLSSTVSGWVLVGHPALHDQVLHSALSQFPVIGSQLGEPKQIGGGITGVVVGVLGALYGGLGVGQASRLMLCELKCRSSNECH
jgi:membrane protein